METQQLHRGRLIDHIQLVVDDLPASLRFYKGIFEVLGIPIGGAAEDHFCERAYHPGYFAAFVIDPHGNNIEAVYHGAAKRISSQRGDRV